MALRKPGGGGGPDGAEQSQATDAKMAATFPTVVEYLTAERWEDGTPREVATLLVLCEDGAWKACLSDRAGQRKGWVSSCSFMGLLQALEKALSDDSMAWRKATPWVPPGGGRKRA